MRSRARSSSRSAPITSTMRRPCWRSSTARRPQELATRAAGALEKAGRRALAQEANQSARRLLVRSVELEPTLQRRFLAARAARRLADLPAQAVEMERVFADATDAGDVRLQGLALTALAENALLRDADLPRGRELVEQALVLLDDAKPEDRIEALATRARIGWWLGDLDDDERWNTKALEVAREIGRKDLEASAVDELASSAIARLDLDRGMRLVAESLELADESGNITVLGWALVSQARIDSLRGRLDEAAAGLAQAEELFSESGQPVGARPGQQPLRLGRAATGRPACRRAPVPRRDPDPEAARGPRNALREPARPGAGARLAEEDRRGGALRARGTRDRRPPRHDLPRDDADGARDRAGRPGASTRRPKRCCARRSPSSTGSRCC